MKKLLLLLIMVGMMGCRTHLQKADQFLTVRNYPEAQKFYAKELAVQQAQAQLPIWNGKACNYQFNRENTRRAVWGMAQTYRETGDRDLALYYYFYYTQFSVRHGLAHETRTETWRDYLADPLPEPATNAAPITESSDAITQ